MCIHVCSKLAEDQRQKIQLALTPEIKELNCRSFATVTS